MSVVAAKGAKLARATQAYDAADRGHSFGTRDAGHPHDPSVLPHGTGRRPCRRKIGVDRQAAQFPVGGAPRQRSRRGGREEEEALPPALSGDPDPAGGAGRAPREARHGGAHGSAARRTLAREARACLREKPPGVPDRALPAALGACRSAPCRMSEAEFAWRRSAHRSSLGTFRPGDPQRPASGGRRVLPRRAALPGVSNSGAARRSSAGLRRRPLEETRVEGAARAARAAGRAGDPAGSSRRSAHACRRHRRRPSRRRGLDPRVGRISPGGRPRGHPSFRSGLEACAQRDAQTQDLPRGAPRALLSLRAAAKRGPEQAAGGLDVCRGGPCHASAPPLGRIRCASGGHRRPAREDAGRERSPPPPPCGEGQRHAGDVGRTWDRTSPAQTGHSRHRLPGSRPSHSSGLPAQGTMPMRMPSRRSPDGLTPAATA